MSLSLKKALGGSSSRPIGSLVGFPNLQADPNPLINIDSREYLRSGYVLVGEEAKYLEMYEKFPGKKHDPTKPWQVVLPSVGVSDLRGVDYGNGLWIAVGFQGKICSSLDGINWESQDSLTTNNLYGIKYANGIWVVVGDRGSVFTSEDGVSWVSRNLGLSPPRINAVAYGNGLWVIVGNTGRIFTSIDAVTWKQELADTSLGNISSIAFGNGVWKATLASGDFHLVESDDGETWTPKSMQSEGFQRSSFVAYGNGLWIIKGTLGHIATSSDGETWSLVNPGVGNVTVNSVVFYNNTFLLLAHGAISSSEDGVSWTGKTVNLGTATPLNYFSATYLNGVWAVVGQNGSVLLSNNREDWEYTSSSLKGFDLNSIEYGDNLWMVCGYHGKLAISADGIEWELRDAGFDPSQPIDGVSYGNGLWVARGGPNNNTLATSSDGNIWTAQKPGGITSNYHSARYINGTWVIGMSSGRIATSSDGDTWTIQTIPELNNINTYAIDINNGLWVLAGSGGKLATSKNGNVWTTQDSGFGSSIIRSIAYGNGIWVIVGASGKLATSVDGVSWVLRDSGFGTSIIFSVIFEDGIWVAVGASGKISVSIDGVSWTLVASDAISVSIRDLCFINGSWVFVGDNGMLGTTTTLPAIGLSKEETQGDAVKYMRIK